MDFTDTVLRGDGALTVGERELIATYVSALNACRFCAGSHLLYARAFGVADGTVDALLADIETAPVEERLKPLLRYVKALNTLPSRLTPKDAADVLDAGLSERALYEAIRVCALFNMMNRIVEGTGVNFDYAAAPQAHPAADGDPSRQAHSYSAFGASLTRTAEGDGDAAGVD